MLLRFRLDILHIYCLFILVIVLLTQEKIHGSVVIPTYFSGICRDQDVENQPIVLTVLQIWDQETLTFPEPRC